MGRHAKSRHVDADDAHAVDLLRQGAQRHARRGGHAEIGDDDRVVERGIGEPMHRLADVLVEFSCDQSLGVERHVADRSLGAIEMRGEGEAVDAAGRARQHGGGAAHAQADTQGAEGRAHRLRLVVRSLRIILPKLLKQRPVAGSFRRARQLGLAAMAAGALRRHRADAPLNNRHGNGRLDRIVDPRAGSAIIDDLGPHRRSDIWRNGGRAGVHRQTAS